MRVRGHVAEQDWYRDLRLVHENRSSYPKTPGADQVKRFGAALSNSRCHSNKSPFTFSQKCSFLSLSCGVLVRIYVVGQSLAKDETRRNREKRLIIQAALGPGWAWEYIHLNLCGDGMRGWVGCTTANIINGRKHAKDNGYAPIREKEHLLSCTWDPVM